MAAGAELKDDFHGRLVFDRDDLSLFWKIRMTGGQCLLNQRQIDCHWRVAKGIFACKYLGAVRNAGDRNGAVRKSVFDGKSFSRLNGDFSSIIGPALKLKENCISAGWKIGD